MILSTAPTTLPIWLSPHAYLGDSVLVIDGQVVEDMGGLVFLAPHELHKIAPVLWLHLYPMVMGEWTADYA